MEDFKEKLIDFGFIPSTLKDEKKVKRFYDSLDRSTLGIIAGNVGNDLLEVWANRK